MDRSNCFGEANIGNIERPSGSSSSSSSSRKGKKNNQHKPKQPQRGLGVAQLERIRLHSQMACSGYHPPYPSNFNNEDPRVQTPYSSSVPPSSFSYPSSSSTSFSASYGFHSNIAIGLPELYERTNTRYGDSQPTNTARSWEHANAILQTHSSAQPNITRPLLNLHDLQHIDTKNHRSGSAGSSSQNSESSDNQEPDLELRLSL